MISEFTIIKTLQLGNGADGEFYHDGLQWLIYDQYYWWYVSY